MVSAEFGAPNSELHGESRTTESLLDPLPRSFYLRPTLEVARDLLGRYLVFDPGDDGRPRVGRVVETEAYLGEADLACHSSRGRTARTEPMYGEGGHAYIYLVYGMYWCLNAVTEEIGQPCAVLLRAVEPLAGIEASTDGPGKVCRAYGLTGQWNRADLTSSALRLTVGERVSDPQIGRSARVGVAYAGDWAALPYRFFVQGNRFVSRPPSTPGRNGRSASDRRHRR